jgi:hypothetical protein
MLASAASFRAQRSLRLAAPAQVRKQELLPKLNYLDCQAALLVLFAFPGMAAIAQPVDLPIPAASSDLVGAGVKVMHLPGGAVYSDAQGHVLYGMNMRTLHACGLNPQQIVVGHQQQVGGIAERGITSGGRARIARSLGAH